MRETRHGHGAYQGARRQTKNRAGRCEIERSRAVTAATPGSLTTRAGPIKVPRVRSLVAAGLVLALAGCGDQSSAPAPGSRPVETQCAAGDQVRVTVFVDAPNDRVYGMHTRVRYPAELSIPGHRDDPTVVDRVRFVLDASNIARVVNDQDSDRDGVDDTIQALAAAAVETFPVGKFVEITFDCVTTTTSPRADLFPCQVAGLTDIDFNEVGSAGTCRVVVAPPSS